jgi:hypothetical protein
MELGHSSEATSCAASEEFPNILWNPLVPYHVHKSFTGPYLEPDHSSTYHLNLSP